ncbi:hydroxyproline-rich glycoprotein family protein [Striga hermonthica]|uniref:Hydroxyproline-rich glycoprotein family protein n=1 Tax=Striga hermonthica TaxID=68872 RepID=A0A9N7NFG6_STRHE|nr:hydroxyproline-rich glycoprotein family protein [Striga hermonthica]
MSSVPTTVETVNAAATAIVTAESRVQPSSIQKRRWGNCWSIYSCFGSCKENKRIGHAILVSDPPCAPINVPSISENRNQSSSSSSIVLPFIAPPSSPASFLQSDPPSATYSPGGPSPGPRPIYAIGPYAHETQLVSPPVFSTFTTEPSTASFTPPPEPVQMTTTPSSPEVPFAQLLSSSLARKGRNSGKFPLSQYDFRPYHYPGSPGGHVKSPGSAISTSGTSSPFFPDKRPILEFRMGEAPKFLGYEHYKWDSRVGSGSLTPCSKLDSGTLTPNGENKAVVENRVLRMVLPATSELKPQNDDLVDHRVSFELFGEDIPTCVVRAPSLKNGSGYEIVEGGTYRKEFLGSRNEDSLREHNEDSLREHCNGESVNEEEFHQKHRTISLGSSKDFNFNNEKGQVSEKSSVDCEWWTSEKAVKKELGPRNSWSFFPMLQSEVS